MRSSFRAKLWILVGAAGLSLLLLVVLDALIASSDEEQLERIEATYLPLLELGPGVAADFERLRRAFQDAAAAADEAQLAQADRLKDQLFVTLEKARGLLPPAEVSLLSLRVDRYVDTARTVTQRMIRGETGEALLEEVEQMQMRHRQADTALRRATSFDRQRLEGAFESLRSARQRAAKTRILVSLTCLALVLVLSGWIGRRVIASLEELALGFARFGRNELTEPIRVLSADEIGEVAQRANVMARNLFELGVQREQANWLITAQAQLGKELAGELSPEEVGQRAVSCLARYLDAPVAAFYAVSADRELRLLAGHGLTADGSRAGAGTERGGLLGSAAEKGDVVALRDIPDDYLRIQSGLGEAKPRVIWFLPMAYLGSPIAVLEFALLHEPREGLRELFLSVRDNIAVALHAAFMRVAKQQLLREMEEQARRLTAQEEELRSVNEELTAQQEELRAANEELVERTEQLEAQKRVLGEKNRDLETARERLQQQTIQLETVSRYKSQFLANMSHELRTPLNSMLILSDLLARNEAKNLTEQQVEFASTIHAAGTDLLTVINQVLDLAKIEAGKLEVRPDTVVVRDLVAHLRRMYAPLASGKHLELVVEISPEVPETIRSDRARIEQILTNLIGNAIKFTDRGKVVLRVQGESGDANALVTFSVIDTGMGIAPSDQARIFELFEQVDGGSQRRHGGTGLGLSIARQLARLLGGDLTVSSELGKGSTFTVTIAVELSVRADADRGAAASRDPGERRTKVASSPSSNGHSKGEIARSAHSARAPSVAVRPAPDGRTILIVEDHMLFAERVAELANECGLNALLAKDGETGIRVARVHVPVGIVLDVKLPDIDGFEVLEKLRTFPETKDIPVHFVSCLDEVDRAHALGALGYLRKPASRAEIIQVIERLAPAVPRRVLVVEDDSQLGGSLVTLLSDLGIEATCAHSGKDALSELRTQQFTCMILDLGLPDIDGLEILARMEKDDGLPKVPVIVHTGRALNKAETRRLEAYTESIVLKGAGSLERVTEELRGFMDQLGRPGYAAALSRGALHIDGSLSGKKVLVADDDMRTAYALSALLRGKGVEVLLADTGRMAVDMLAKETRVDAVIMDVMMPEMDGYEAMRQIRREARFRELPIIALTAKAMRDDRARCIEAGASDYMPKPIDGDRLLSVLHAWLSTG